jgi:EAL and modified HD-GYP domain-containing signal transduction protein
MDAGSFSEDYQNRCFVALQPIFDREGSVFGYEALCRTDRNNSFTGDSRSATRSIVRDWLLDGLYRYTGPKPVFVNCTREDLIGGFITLPPVPIVVEILETVEVDEWLLEVCRKLKCFGHQIALDDFQLFGSDPRLVELADYIKVDFQLSDRTQRKDMMRALRSMPVRFVAEKVESREEFETALDDGFQLFQGYYLARPVLLSKERTYLSLLNHFRLRWLSRHRRRKGK